MEADSGYVLVTGGLGYIGSHAVVELYNNGYKTVIVDNLYNSSEKCHARLEEITGKTIPFEKATLCDYEVLCGIFKKYQINAVMHFAAYKAVGESTFKPLEYYENNLMSTINVLKAMREHGVHKIIYSGSAAVYGNNPECTEEASTCPNNPYGETKLIGDFVLRDLANADEKLEAISLRYFNPIGSHPSGKIGEDPKDIPNNLMPFVLQVAMGKLPQLRVFGSDYDTIDGTGVRDYIHVMDLVEAHIAALGKLHPGFRIYNLGTGRGTSVLEIVSAFEKATRVEIKREMAPRRPGDVEKLMAVPEKAEKELGWKAKRTIEDACKDGWNWIS